MYISDFIRDYPIKQGIKDEWQMHKNFDMHHSYLRLIIYRFQSHLLGVVYMLYYFLFFVLD